MAYPSRPSDRATEGSVRLLAGSFMTDVFVWAGKPLRIATSPRSVRNELAKKFSNHTPSRFSRCMLGMTGSPSTSSSITVRAKLSRITTTTFGLSVSSTRTAGSAFRPFPRRASNRTARVRSSKKG